MLKGVRIQRIIDASI